MTRGPEAHSKVSPQLVSELTEEAGWQGLFIPGPSLGGMLSSSKNRPILQVGGLLPYKL